MSELRRLYAAVVVQSIKDAVRDAIRGHEEAIADLEAWLRSSDGQEVTSLAGIELREAAIQAVMRAVSEAVQYRNLYSFTIGSRRTA